MSRFMKIMPVIGACLLVSAWAAAADELAETDRLFAQGGLANLQQSIALTLKAVEQNPGSFEANWKCARAHREYATQAKRQDVLSELLIQMGGDDNKAEAKAYLEKAAQSPDTYFKNWVARLLVEIGK